MPKGCNRISFKKPQTPKNGKINRKKEKQNLKRGRTVN